MAVTSKVLRCVRLGLPLLGQPDPLVSLVSSTGEKRPSMVYGALQHPRCGVKGAKRGLFGLSGAMSRCSRGRTCSWFITLPVAAERPFTL